jgi:hypothetical protein
MGSEAATGAMPWATIESAGGASAVSAERRAAVAAAAAASPEQAGAALVLRRHDRPVLGSIDLGGRIMQRHGRAVIVGSALFMVPMIACNLALSVLALDRFDQLDDSLPRLPELFGGVDAATGAETLLAFVSLVVSSLTAALVGGYCTRLVLRHHSSAPVTIGDGVSATLRRLPALFIGWLFGHWWLILGALIATSTGGEDMLLLSFVLVPLGSWLAALSLVVSPVIIAERLGGLSGMRRGYRLSRRRLSAAWGMIVASIIVGGGLRLMITYLPAAAESTGLITFGDYQSIAQGVASQVAQLVSVPLIALATVQFYLQVRVHAEGADIQLRAAQAWPQPGAS